MKRTILFIGLIAMISSCKKELTEVPKDFISKANFIKTLLMRDLPLQGLIPLWQRAMALPTGSSWSIIPTTKTGGDRRRRSLYSARF